MRTKLSADSLLFFADLKQLVPLSRATIWRMERRGEFPRRILISDKRVAWHRGEIEQWVDRRSRSKLRKNFEDIS